MPQRALLEAGVTGMRMAGAPHFIDVALKRAFDSGQHVGPRLYTCGWFLTTTAGHALGTGFALPCDGPDGFVRTIREHIQAGVDHIKLNLTGGIMGPAWDRHWHSFFTESELQAAFAICHQRGLKVMAHAASAGAVKAALRLGAHSVEHGYIMDDECLALFREHDAWYVPTLGITHLTPGQATTRWEKQWVEQRGLSPDLVKRAEDAVDEHRAWFRRALAAGLKMAVGSDVRPVRDGALLELGLWVKSRRDAVADAPGGDQARGRYLRRGPRSGHGRGRQARRPDRRAREPARRHRQRANAAAGVQGRSSRRRPPWGGHVSIGLRTRGSTSCVRSRASRDQDRIARLGGAGLTHRVERLDADEAAGGSAGVIGHPELKQ